ncbi:MAG: methyltransferase domain-containing protein, partial [Wenzhouxiangellaceae bacterium]|nr:methyltransferase domain-containing protein [Wenzhouxiangellaceae bacterium]
VTAVELQPDFHDAASRLTRRCGLDDRVRHVRADFLEAEFEDRHDALVSWLTFLHIDDHAALFRRCRAALVDGGALFAEDFVADAPLTVRERRLLSEEVYCRALPDRDRYRERLESAGFTDVEMHSMTEPWTRFVVARERAFAADRERYRRLHGRAAEERLARFYGVVRELFEGGNLGGARIVARAAPNPGTAALR